MKNYVGEIISKARKKNNLSQDQYGMKYNITGPAICKMVNGEIKPSIKKWLRMATDYGLSERRAVLMWIKDRLPDEYDQYIEIERATMAEKEIESVRKRRKKPNYSKLESREQIREIIKMDKTLPKGMRDLLSDDEFWTLFKPTGSEINMLRDIFAPLGRGSKTTYREALRLIREFAYSF